MPSKTRSRRKKSKKTVSVGPAYPCVACGEDCESERPSIECSKCLRWMHTDNRRCVFMSQDLLDSWEKDVEFLCRDCAFTDESYDVITALKRMRQAEDAVKGARQERLLHQTYDITLPARIHIEDVSVPCDVQATNILRRRLPTLLEDYTPLKVGADGNCLFRAISLGLFGTEQHHHTLRLLTAMEVAEHRACYDTRHPDFVDLVRDCRITFPDYAETMQQVCTDGAYMELVHLYALSAAIDLPITSYYPSLHEFMAAWNRRVTGRAVKDQPTSLKILWSSISNSTTKTFNANHFVLLKPTSQPVILDTINLCSTPAPVAKKRKLPNDNFGDDKPSKKSTPIQPIPTHEMGNWTLELGSPIPLASPQEPWPAVASSPGDMTIAAEETQQDFDNYDMAKTNPLQNLTRTDVTLPSFREVAALQESSIADVTPSSFDASGNGQITYEVVESSSTRGCPKLFDSEGYSYVIRSKSARATTWRCSVRNATTRCKATVKYIGETYAAGPQQHCHEPRPGAATAAKVTVDIKAKAKANIFRPASQIREAVVKEHYTHAATAPSTQGLKKMEYLDRIANYTRQKDRPKQPKDLQFDLAAQNIPEGFMQADLQIDGQRSVVFANQNQLQLLHQSKSWYADGTFKVVRAPFTQLWSIHAFVRQGSNMKQVPLVFVVMSSRRAVDYEAVLRAVLRLMPSQPRVEEVIMDFEKAAWKAFSKVLPDVRRRGCSFHWGQAVWRKAQELGLRSAYLQDDPTHVYLRRLMSLPLLPAEHIVPIFNALKTKAQSTKLTQFTSYMTATWMEDATHPPTSWSVFGQSVRTNNDLEGWHLRLINHGKAQMPFSMMVSVLHEESCTIDLTLKLVSQKKVCRIQREKFRSIQRKLSHEWDRYRDEEVTAMELLKACASLYCPAT